MGPEREYRGRAKRSQGFTLTELLVAMTILAIALLAVSAMLLFASSNVDYSGGTAQAAALAQRRLEEIRNYPFEVATVGVADVVDMVNGSNPPNPGQPVGPANLPVCLDYCEDTIPGAHGTEFTVQTWVQIVPGTTAPPLIVSRREAMVTVIVSWTEPNLGGAKTLRLDTLVAE